jgi:3-(3-hydroxy-phenyl)propionate hydroxylase
VTALDAATYKSLYFDYPEFDSPVPAEVEVAPGLTHDVIIVGAGPVGLATALDLAERGISVVLLEAEVTIGIGSRAGSLSRRSVEYLASLGIGDELLAQGMVYDAGWTYFRDREIFRLSIPGHPGDQFPPMLKIQQCYIEKYLADRVNAHPRIDIRWGHRLETLRNGPDQVELEVTCPHGAYRTRGRYVVGADGGRSGVRKQIGQHLEGRTFAASFVVADVKMEVDLPVGRRFWYDPPWNPGGSVIMHLQPENIWRFDYSLPHGADEAEELRPERVTRRVADHLAWLGWDAPWELDWMTLYRAHMRIVDRMRVGRTLLAGDAAHLIPIFGVRGLNGGLSDAANLAWKLARVVDGRSPDSLLDSYDAEQHMVFAGNVAAADLSTRFICPANQAARTLRDAALHLAQRHESFRPLLDPRQSQPIPLYGSDLVDGPEPGEGAATPCPLRPGDPLPNLRFDGPDGTDVRFVNDLLSADFTLLRLTAGSRLEIVRRTERVAADDVAVLEVVLPDGAGDEVAAALRGRILLIRPDRYIAAAWPADQTVDLGALLARAASTATAVAGAAS